MDPASFSNVRHWGNNLHRSAWKQIAVHRRAALSDSHTRSYRGLPPAAALSAMQLFAGWKDGVMLKSCLTFTWQTLYHPLLFSSVFRKLAPFILAVFKPHFLCLIVFPGTALMCFHIIIDKAGCLFKWVSESCLKVSESNPAFFGPFWCSVLFECQ